MRDKIAYFETIYDTYATQIFRFIYLRTSHAQLAEDITSETFLRLWKVITKDQKVNNVRALLYVIARGLVVDHYRSKNHGKEVALETVPEQDLSDGNSILEQTQKKSEIEILRGKLSLLRKEYQEIIILRYIEDLEYPEIAGVLKKTEATVRVLLHRAIHALKEKL